MCCNRGRERGYCILPLSDACDGRRKSAAEQSTQHAHRSPQNADPLTMGCAASSHLMPSDDMINAFVAEARKQMPPIPNSHHRRARGFVLGVMFVYRRPWERCLSRNTLGAKGGISAQYQESLQQLHQAARRRGRAGSPLVPPSMPPLPPLPPRKSAAPWPVRSTAAAPEEGGTFCLCDDASEEQQGSRSEPRNVQRNSAADGSHIHAHVMWCVCVYVCVC